MRRTRMQRLSFARPFSLAGIAESLPAGTYDIESEEERLEGISFETYRRIGTVIHLPAAPGPTTRLVAIDHDDLQKALENDAG